MNTELISQIVGTTLAIILLVCLVLGAIYFCIYATIQEIEGKKKQEKLYQSLSQNDRVVIDMWIHEGKVYPRLFKRKEKTKGDK